MISEATAGGSLILGRFEAGALARVASEAFACSPDARSDIAKYIIQT
jgi:hypothetical protein